VFFRVQIFIASRQGLGLAQFEAAVDAEQSRQGRGEGGADQEARASRSLQKRRIDVGRVDEEMRPKKIARKGRELGQVFGQLRLGVAPGEIGVRLRKAEL